MFVDSHKRETKIGFFRIVLGIEIDQRSADPPAHIRGGACVDEGAPDEIARRREVTASDRKKLALRQSPQDAYKSEQQQARLEESNAQVGREIGQMLGVGLETLIGVGAERARTRETKARFGLSH